MDAAHKMEAKPLAKQNRLVPSIALLLFLVIGFVASCPLLTFGGEVAGNCKEAFLILAFVRLGWTIYKRTFRFRDYFIYFALVIGFCIWVDSHF